MRHGWWWLAGAAILLGMVLAMFQPTLQGDSDMADFAWSAIWLRFFLYSPVFFAALGLLLFSLVIARWLFNWRRIKWCLRGMAALLTLVLLFYAEEDWRGYRAWSQYRREWEGRGGAV
jgi:hypothetical protein